ncbi:MAG: RHS repeat-associated core domain-containing protein, partial [Sedimentisphaerales bacterium]|nr:RHS repeat-associated core domain-containing protein [Sedimentisphaerales bacterium]
YFYLHDRLGSVRLIVDTSGVVKNCYTYNPFGELFASETTENVLNPFKFSGQFFDNEIGQYHLRARQYDPYLSRFTSRDPADGKFEEPLTLHVYLYCTNNPINLIDPWGLISIAFYDWNETGAVTSNGRRLANADDLKNAADDFELHIGVSSLKEIEFYLWLFSFETIDNVYIYDHGVGEDNATNWMGRQEIGPQPIHYNDPLWAQAASYVDPNGSIHLRGCGVAAGGVGKAYISLLAMAGGRKVTAFDRNIECTRWSWGEPRERWGRPDYYSYGNLWEASPLGSTRIIAPSSWWTRSGFSPVY